MSVEETLRENRDLLLSLAANDDLETSELARELADAAGINFNCPLCNSHLDRGGDGKIRCTNSRCSEGVINETDGSGGSQ